MARATLTSKGQVTIPVEVRKALGVEAGDRLLFRVREDGLPVDPWLRVHVRAGGRIEKVARRSMVVPGTVEEWREWTGLAFDKTGPVAVPRALVPVHCDVEHGTATYVEPNVWVVHRTGV